MPYVIGIVLSVGVALFARHVGLDRDRAFYPTVMIVIASYYVLFAAMSGSVQTVVIESVVMTLFAAAAHAADFADAAHLTRTFYQMVGMAPSALMRGDVIEIASPFNAE
jgi:hypothetical protein